ncbi:hypothetical protein LOY86_006867, partial [Ophidiomyces ophidiicola]
MSWAEVTAICDQIIMKAMFDSISLHSDYDIIHTDVNPPEIAILISYIKCRKFNTFESLFFIIKQTSGETTATTVETSYQNHEPTPDRISKTIVFMMKKNVLKSILDVMLITSDVMAHGADVSDIKISVQYGIWTVQISGQSRTFVLLVEKNYKESWISDDSKTKSVPSTVTASVAASVVESVVISMDSLFVEDGQTEDTQLPSELDMKPVSGTK